jgi:hypothetical protein
MYHLNRKHGLKKEVLGLFMKMQPDKLKELLNDNSYNRL